MLRTVWDALAIAFRMASSTPVGLLPTISLNRYTWSLTARLPTCPPPAVAAAQPQPGTDGEHAGPRMSRRGSKFRSGLDGDLDRFALGHDVEGLEDAVERQVHRDEVLDRDLTTGDVLQRPLVVRRGRTVGPHDHQLSVMDQVRIELDEGVGLRQSAEEGDAPTPRRHPDRLLLRDVGRGRGDDHVGATPVGELFDALDDVDLPAVDDLVGLDRVGGHRQPIGEHVDEEDTARAVGASQPGVQAADRAGTEDDDRVTVADVHQFLRIDGARERLGHGGLVEADVVGDPVEPVDLQHLTRNDEELREAAVVLIAHRGLVLADRHPAPAALVALPVGHGGDHLGAVTGGPAAHIRPHLDHLAGDLVPEGARRAQVLVPVVEDLHVGAAGGAVADPQLHFVRAALGLGDILDPNVLGCVEPQGLHPLLPLSPPAISARTLPADSTPPAWWTCFGLTRR